MRILHRISKGERDRKGPGLAPHIPMPEDATDPGAEPEPGLSEADKDALEVAATKTAALYPAARARGTRLAEAMRASHGDAALRVLLDHLHWMDSVHGQGIFPATWGQHICAVQAACHELNGGGDE